MERHELSALFPPMSKEEYAGLVADIRDVGQIEHCISYDGKILDGWHRFKACKEAGVEPVVKELRSGRDPKSWVLSRNLHRRSLSKNQRVAIALKVVEWRPKSAGRPTRDEAAEEEANPVRKHGPAPDRPVRMREVAKMTGSSMSLVNQVKRRIRDGHGDAIASGKETVASLNRKEGVANPRTPIEKARDRIRMMEARIAELEAEVASRAQESHQLKAAYERLENRMMPEDQKDRMIADFRARIRSLVAENERLKSTNAYLKDKLEGK